MGDGHNMQGPIPIFPKALKRLKQSIDLIEDTLSQIRIGVSTAHFCPLGVIADAYPGYRLTG